MRSIILTGVLYVIVVVSQTYHCQTDSRYLPKKIKVVVSNSSTGIY